MMRGPATVSRASSGALALVLFLGLMGCEDDGPTPPPNLRFGQVGEVRVTVVAPLFFDGGEGELQQVLTWSSTGAWQLRESLSYEGLPGDEDLSRNEASPAAYASVYAELITQLNDYPGLRLFLPDTVLPQDLDPECARGETRVTFLIRDQVKEQTASWTRCASGNLGSLSISAAGPDAAAGRVIQAAILAAEYTQGSDFRSTYFGSVPFGTLDRGEDSQAGLEEPRCFQKETDAFCQGASQWPAFWQAHKGSAEATPPEVNWETQMVLVAAVGRRTEAGDSVEVRRVLQTGDGTQVNLFERIPGDFCSPAARTHYPIHIVIAPRTLPPIRFSEVVQERVSCGG